MPFNGKMSASSENWVISSNVTESASKTSSDEAESKKNKGFSSSKIPSDNNQSASEDIVMSPVQISADSSAELFELASLKVDRKFEDDIGKAYHDDDANNCPVEKTKSSSSKRIASENSEESQSSSEGGLTAPAQISIGSLIEMFE